MTPLQSRMARAALGWRADDTASAAGISRLTVARFETGATVAAELLDAMRAAYEAAGVEFIAAGSVVRAGSTGGGEGVRLR